ncbi:cytochrome c oxidase subunit II [Aquabacter spiritensis]|uniref:Cytochrome aa3 subunit 2 n=1 Tax=Aquabacter spiritensis TaxID=933073 RepID=A0A4R3LTB9_9HYPH|nr:cytochrome c oxidase subunit II [Aquabacter spiritensis]TCT01557.1 cytochrome c oxidase subunit 2 [Aquabacter spiritensis]
MSGLDAVFSGVQSALAPAGSAAAGIATLTWIMFAGAAIIFLIVMACVAFALFAPQERRAFLSDHRMVIGGGIIFPFVVLTALLVYGLVLTRDLVRAPGTEPLEIHVTGEQFWWRVHYPAATAETPPLVTANEIHVPVGRPVRFLLTSADVIHSFWIPSLAGKLDMIPGHTNRLLLEAERPGIYRGQCAEFCGSAHALMAFDVVAHTPEAFEAWMRGQREDARQPVTTLRAQGRDLFLESGCGACHTVRGTSAAGTLGPDLTHVGSRRTIGAGLFPTNRGTLAGWIASTQHLKPASKMPSFGVFTGEQLRALAAYLDGLK